MIFRTFLSVTSRLIGLFILLGSMKHYGLLLATILGPGIICGLTLTSYTAFQSFVLGDCDIKFGCVGGVQFMAALAAAASTFSALGLILPVALFRSTIRALPRIWLLLIILLLAACLVVMLLTIGHWPFEPFAPLLTAWTAASAIIGLAVLLLARCMAPNRVAGGITPPAPTPPSMRVRTRRFP